MKNIRVLQDLLDSLTSKSADVEYLYMKTKDQKYKEAAKSLYNAVSDIENAIDIINDGL